MIFLKAIFILFFYSLETYEVNPKIIFDPLFIMQTLKGEKKKVWITKKINSNFPKIGNLTFAPQFPLLILEEKEIEDNLLQCIKKEIKNPQNCFKYTKDDEDIVYIRFPRKLRPLTEEFSTPQDIKRLFTKIKESSSEIGAKEARDVFRVSGKGVAIGIIDTGIRWNSDFITYKIRDSITRDFGSSKNFSKIALIWDQENENYENGFTYPSGFTYGLECKFPSRRDSFFGKNECPHTDKEGHGSHITGIMAMEEENSGEIGVSPSALFIFVASSMYEPDVIEAVKYIFSRADEFKLPAVINISLGGHFGPHDGTSLFEMELKKFLGKGKIIVAAAGNEANKNIHIGGKFSGTVSAVVDVRGDCEVQFWFPLDSGISLKVDFFGNSSEVKKGERKILVDSHPKIAIVDFGGGADFPFQYLGYSFSNSKEGAVFASSEIFGHQAVIWLNIPGQKRIDGWISSDPSNCSFLNQGDIKPTPEGTISVPGTSQDIIAVGSYDISSEKGNLSRFSSWGFEESEFIKPNIVAPGEIIYSLCPNDDSALCGGRGTSQSTPHVSGAVALALERNPSLTPSEIIQALCSGAKKDDFTGYQANNKWGCGKLYIPSFLSSITPQSKPQRQKDINYETLYEKIGGKKYAVLSINSQTPFRVISAGNQYYDMGWSTKHELYFDSFPQNVEIEFADGEIKKLNIQTGGIDVGTCGCFVSGKNALFPFLIQILLIFIATRIIMILFERRT
ncbi:Serine protease AprX [bacterium HR19]|nr:Serine protease AprX [bacterium HR19]